MYAPYILRKHNHKYNALEEVKWVTVHYIEFLQLPNGSGCLFKAQPGGIRNGKAVLMQHRDIDDPDHGGGYTVKVYHSEKAQEYREMVNERILLKPDTNAFGCSPIVLENNGEDLVVLGELLGVIGG